MVELCPPSYLVILVVLVFCENKLLPWDQFCGVAFSSIDDFLVVMHELPISALHLPLTHHPSRPCGEAPLFSASRASGTSWPALLLDPVPWTIRLACDADRERPAHVLQWPSDLGGWSAEPRDAGTDTDAVGFFFDRSVSTLRSLNSSQLNCLLMKGKKVRIDSWACGGQAGVGTARPGILRVSHTCLHYRYN